MYETKVASRVKSTAITPFLFLPLVTDVGLEGSSYTFPDEVTEIYVVAAGANTHCPSSFPFEVVLSITDEREGL